MSELVQVDFDADQESAQKLNRLVEEIGLSPSELMTNGIALLAVVVKARARGLKLALANQDSAIVGRVSSPSLY